MWEISNSQQLISFGVSLLFGVGFGVYYALFKGIRRAVRHTAAAVFFEDIFFFFSTAVITFLLLLALSVGEIRLYILLGILIGFCAFYFIMSEPVSIGFAFIIKVFRLCFSVVFSFLRKNFGILVKSAAKMVHFCREKFKKCYKYLKKPLKDKGTLVYTKKNKQKV